MNLFRSASLLAVASCSVVASAQTIDTYEPGGSYFSVGPFGNPDVSTFGQTFVAPNSLLTSYTSSFEYLGGSAFTFQFYVAAWDDAGRRVTGPILYTSGVLTSTATSQNYTIAPNVALTTGRRYVAFFSTSGQAVRPVGSMFTSLSRVAYAGGTFVYLRNEAYFDELSSSRWEPGVGLDSSFHAEFSSVPGPAAALPFALMAIKRRKRKA